MIAAEHLYTHAAELAPADALVLTDEARTELQAHRWAQAAWVAARIVALYPNAAEGLALMASALAAQGRSAEALAAADRALAARWEDGSEAQIAATRALRDALARRRP